MAPPPQKSSAAKKQKLTGSGSASVPPTKKTRNAKGPKAHDLAVVVRSGTHFIDNSKSEFIVGKQIGQGGFGRIYDGTMVGSKSPVAIKMEPLANGPLFSEMHVYMKILKDEMLIRWKKDHDIKFLGLPNLIGFGKLDYEGLELRYMVIPKYHSTLESVREKAGVLRINDVKLAARAVLNAYDYLHSQGYVHADVKAANLMMETSKNFEHVVIIDYGLARKLPDVLVEKEEKKKAHNGTALFTSCDAHRGCIPSYRGDLEILAHNMLFWLTGSLPWKAHEADPEYIFEAKKKLIADAEKELPQLLSDPKEAKMLLKYYTGVRKMAFGEKIRVADYC